MALSEVGAMEEDETTEDTINRIMAARKLLPNASYFAFTATPKNKTLEVFGEAYDAGGQNRHRPFHSYTMKQTIQEGFILDVLRHYTPVESYYKLIKNTDTKLLIYGLFQKGRVLVQDGEPESPTSPSTRPRSGARHGLMTIETARRASREFVCVFG